LLTWTELAQNPLHEINRHFSKHLSDAGVPNSYIETKVDVDKILESLEQAKTTCQMIRIGPPYKSQLVDTIKQIDLETRMIGSVDTFLKDSNNKWWPKSIFYYGLTEVFINQQRSIHQDHQALIVGAGAAARAVAAVIAKMGYTKINLTSRYDEQGFLLLRQLKKIFFDIEFKYIPKDRLVLLPGTNNLVVNTTPFIPTNDLLVELYYLNFLRADGVLVDLTVVPHNTYLIQSGQQVGIKLVSR
jgi:shikimate 5-dehydrogenase